MDKIPLVIRRGLRDDWEKPEAPARVAIGNLSELLGFEVSIDLNMTVLLTELENSFPDKETFIPTILGVIQEWVICLTDRLEEDSNTQWTDQLLEHLGRSGGGSMRAKVETVNESRPRTRLAKCEKAADIVIAIPAADFSPSYPLQSAASSFETDFKVMFDEKAAADDPEWTEVSSTKPTPGDHEKAGQDQSAKALPALDALPRPETLFGKLQPCYLIVKVLQKEIVVQASHQPSLELISQYFRKYTRSMKNVTVKIPEVKIELHESSYGLGPLLDSLSITNADSRSTDLQNPVLLLAFIEGALGYSLVTQSSNNNQWVFRKGSI